MKDDDEDKLHIEYQRLVAVIREFEPQLKRTLIGPLGRIPGVASAAWRIKSWPAVLEKQRRNESFARDYRFAEHMIDILSVRVIIEDRSSLEAIEAVVCSSYEIVEAGLIGQPSSRSEPHSWTQYVLRPLRTATDTRGLSHFELQVVTAAAHAIAEVQHLLLYQGSIATEVEIRGNYDVDIDLSSEPESPEAAYDALKGTRRIDAAIEAFERMIDFADVHEKRDVHPFLAKHTYFLHPALETIVSEPAIGVGTEFRPDFIIREATGDYILVEIENPKRTLFTKRGDFTAEVSHAVQQVEDWQEWLEQNLPTAQRQYPDIVSPRGLIVMGRHANLGQKERQKLSRRNINTRGRLEIITYDELISRTRAYLAGIQRILGA